MNIQFPARTPRRMLLGFIGAAILALAAHAATAPVDDAAFEQRLRTLETQLRCLVCQNQTIADSNAGLAEDLRREVREQALSGRSDDQIKQYLKDRYGDFVLYDPPLEPATWLLWFGPFVLLFSATCVALWLIIRRSRVPGPVRLDAAEAQRIELILSDPGGPPVPPT